MADTHEAPRPPGAAPGDAETTGGQPTASPNAIPSSDDPLTPIDSTPAVGVLFVHGAGDHGVGATLTEFGEPLVAWLDGWLSGGRSASEMQSTDLVQPGGAQLLVREADRAAPAHVAVQIRSRGEGQPHRWLFAESRWDQAFTPPRFQEVLTWALTVVPWTVLTQFLGPLSDKARRLRPTIPAVVRFVVDALLALILIVIASVLIQTLALAILVLSVIPLDPVRSIVGSLQRFASTSVGDLYIVLTSPTQRAALAGAVQRDIGWLRARGCRKIVVVAHSQGGFVAHQALTDPWHPRVDLFVTLGSGLIRLTESERARRTHMLIPALVGLLGFVMFVRFGPSAVLGAIGFGQRHPAVALAAEFGFALMLVGLIPIREYLKLRRSGGAAGGLTTSGTTATGPAVRNPIVVLLTGGVSAASPAGRTPIASLPEGTRWVDYVTADDPVLNGTREGRLPPEAEAIDVVNRASVIADHGSYWDNTDQFVAQVALAIGQEDPTLRLAELGPAGTPEVVQAGLAGSWAARLARVDVLERVRLTFGAAILALIVGHWARLSVIGLPISRAVGELPSQIRDLGGPLVEAIVPVAISHATLLGALVVAIAGAGAYRLAVTAWDAWGDDDTVSQWRGVAPDPLTGGAVIFHAWVATIFVLVALVAWYGPAGVVRSILWIRDLRDPITQAFVGQLVGAIPVCAIVLYAATRPRSPNLDPPRVAKAIVGCCLAVVFAFALAAAAPGRRPENLLFGFVISVAATGFTLGPLEPLARLAARTGSWLRSRTDRPLVGASAGWPDVWWLLALLVLPAVVPLAIKGTAFAATVGALIGVVAAGFGSNSAVDGRSRQVRIAGATVAMLGSTMTAIVIAHWLVVRT